MQRLDLGRRENPLGQAESLNALNERVGGCAGSGFALGFGKSLLQKISTAAPKVTAVSPNGAAISGKNVVTITGSGFSSSTAVTIGGSSCATTSVSSTSIKCTVPAHLPGSTSLVVLNSDGQSASQAFAYHEYFYAATDVGVSAYEVTPATGNLTQLNGGLPYLGVAGFSLTLSPSSETLYAVSYTGGVNDGIYAYPIDLTTGALGTPQTYFTADNYYTQTIVTPSFLFQPGYDGSNIYTFTVGSPAQFLGGPTISTIPAGDTFVSGAATDPAQHYYFITEDTGADPIHCYTIGPTGLTYVSSTATPYTMDAMTLQMDHTGTYLLAGEYLAANFHVWKLPSGGGTAGCALVQKADVPLASGTEAILKVFSPNNKFLYVLQSDTAQVWSQYSFNASTGAFLPLGTPSVNFGQYTYSMNFEASGTMFYAVDGGAPVIRLYSVDPVGGQLNPVVVATFPTGGTSTYAPGGVITQMAP